MGEVGDDALLRAVAAGDERAFETLYDRHSALVSGFVAGRLRATKEVEETVQDTWLGCWRGAGTFRGQASVRSWLLGIARRQVMMRYRSARSVPAQVPLEDYDAADPAPGPSESAVAVAGEEHLVEQVRRLSPKLYETAMLAWVQDMAYPEIAEALGVPVGTVKSRIARVRRELQGSVREERTSVD